MEERTNFEDWLLTKKNDNNLQDIHCILKKISVICKIISAKIRRAAIKNLTGSTTITNSHGEIVKTLDIISNSLFIDGLSKLPVVHSLISEEDLCIMEINDEGKYVVAFDPLDGSSNIDANVNIGSIFGIYPKGFTKGREQLASGYVLYGTSTMLVIGYDKEVNGFTLDEGIGEYILTHPLIKIGKNKIYSINEGNTNKWSNRTVELVDKIKKEGFSTRYIGSMVGDVHRTLLYGGLFMYPHDKKNVNGKLRYLYEVGPMSLITEYAGGKSMCAKYMHCLDVVPDHIHQRCPIYLGNEQLIDKYKEFF